MKSKTPNTTKLPFLIGIPVLFRNRLVFQPAHVPLRRLSIPKPRHPLSKTPATTFRNFYSRDATGNQFLLGIHKVNKPFRQSFHLDGMHMRNQSSRLWYCWLSFYFSPSGVRSPLVTLNVGLLGATAVASPCHRSKLDSKAQKAP